jgi:hypothetical protein
MERYLCPRVRLLLQRTRLFLAPVTRGWRFTQLYALSLGLERVLVSVGFVPSVERRLESGGVRVYDAATHTLVHAAPLPVHVDAHERTDGVQCVLQWRQLQPTRDRDRIVADAAWTALSAALRDVVRQHVSVVSARLHHDELWYPSTSLHLPPPPSISFLSLVV